MKYQDRAEYGEYLIKSLASDLGSGKRLLYRMVSFYRCYQIVSTVSAQLSWSHYTELVEVQDKKERHFYQHQAILHSWSVRELRKQIRSQLYKNTSSNDLESTLQTKLPALKTKNIFKPIL